MRFIFGDDDRTICTSVEALADFMDTFDMQDHSATTFRLRFQNVGHIRVDHSAGQDGPGIMFRTHAAFFDDWQHAAEETGEEPTQMAARYWGEAEAAELARELAQMTASEIKEKRESRGRL